MTRSSVHEPSFRALPSKAHGGLEIVWTEAGKKVFRQNRELLRAFRHIRDTFPTPESVPKQIDLGYAFVERIRDRPSMADSFWSNTRNGIYRITLKNGSEFVFKDGIREIEPYDNEFDGHELETAFQARSAGLQVLEHYAQIHVPNSDRYFVLMESCRLPTLADLKVRLPPGNWARVFAERQFERQKKILVQAGLGDASIHNCFVKIPSWKGAELYWFDLRKKLGASK